jgi:hypothetical protein
MMSVPSHASFLLNPLSHNFVKLGQEIVITKDPTQIAQLNGLMQQAANESAARHAFPDHTARNQGD